MDMDIFDLAKAKKLFGGGGGKRGGTAVPVGQRVERIYFNTKNTAEETIAYLSQLTYVEVGSFTPCAIIYAIADASFTGHMIFARHYVENDTYEICYQSDLAGTVVYQLFNGVDKSEYANDWTGFNRNDGGNFTVGHAPIFIDFAVTDDMQPITDYYGLPIGAENEKIKNVLSITPF